MQPQKLVGPIVIKISNSNIYLFMSRHDVNVGLDFCTAIAILQIKCATLVHLPILTCAVICTGAICSKPFQTCISASTFKTEELWLLFKIDS